MATIRGLIVGGLSVIIASACAGQQIGQRAIVHSQSGAPLPTWAINSGPPPLSLLAVQPSVQEELNLNKTQSQRIQAINSTAQGRFMQAIREGRQGFNGKIEAAERDFDRDLAAILGPKQMARLGQIGAQLQGPLALVTPKAAEKLQLSQSQLNSLRQLTRLEAEKANAILTDRQRAQWQEMTGPPFTGQIPIPAGAMTLPRD